VAESLLAEVYTPIAGLLKSLLGILTKSVNEGKVAASACGFKLDLKVTAAVFFLAPPICVCALYYGLI